MDKTRFPYFFSINPLETQHIGTWIALWQRFDISRVGVLAYEDEYEPPDTTIERQTTASHSPRILQFN